MTKKDKKNKNSKWILTITISAFIISFMFSLVSELVLPNAGLVLGIILVLLFILIGIVFDIIGVAVASADEKPFHSMAARKVRGAKTAVAFKKMLQKCLHFVMM